MPRRLARHCWGGHHAGDFHRTTPKWRQPQETMTLQWWFFFRALCWADALALFHLSLSRAICPHSCYWGKFVGDLPNGPELTIRWLLITKQDLFENLVFGKIRLWLDFVFGRLDKMLIVCRLDQCQLASFLRQIKLQSQRLIIQARIKESIFRVEV